MALILATTATKFVDTHTSLAQINADSFGHFILPAIKAHLLAQTSANEVHTQMLVQYKTKMITIMHLNLIQPQTIELLKIQKRDLVSSTLNFLKYLIKR